MTPTSSRYAIEFTFGYLIFSPITCLQTKPPKSMI